MVAAHQFQLSIALTDQRGVPHYVEVFDKHRGSILDGVSKAIVDPTNFDLQGRLHVRGRDLAT